MLDSERLSGICVSEGANHASVCELKKVVGSEAKREAVYHVTKVYDVSERRACAVLQANQSMVHYQSSAVMMPISVMQSSVFSLIARDLAIAAFM